MRMMSRVTLVLSVFLPLTAAWSAMQAAESDSTPQSQQERKPVAQDEVSPIQDGETSGRECGAVRSQPIEAPSPGVPMDNRTCTLRQLKERAKGR